MVDETTDLSNAVQLALVLRYVTDGGVKERFVRFEDATSVKRPDDIAGLIIRFLEENECLNKVVAQCFDGAAVMSSGLNGVQAKVKERAPLALFTLLCTSTKFSSDSRGLKAERMQDLFRPPQWPCIFF